MRDTMAQIVSVQANVPGFKYLSTTSSGQDRARQVLNGATFDPSGLDSFALNLGADNAKFPVLPAFFDPHYDFRMVDFPRSPSFLGLAPGSSTTRPQCIKMGKLVFILERNSEGKLKKARVYRAELTHASDKPEEVRGKLVRLLNLDAFPELEFDLFPMFSDASHASSSSAELKAKFPAGFGSLKMYLHLLALDYEPSPEHEATLTAVQKVLNDEVAKKSLVAAAVPVPAAVAGAAAAAAAPASEPTSADPKAIKFPVLVALGPSHSLVKSGTTDPSYKVLLLGPADAGKTQLMQQMTGSYSPSFTSTVGLDFRTLKFKMPNASSETKVQVWDTSGQERYRTITTSYFRGTDAVFIMGNDGASVLAWKNESENQLQNGGRQFADKDIYVALYSADHSAVVLVPFDDASFQVALSQAPVSKGRQEELARALLVAVIQRLSVVSTPVPAPAPVVAPAAAGAGAPTGDMFGRWLAGGGKVLATPAKTLAPSAAAPPIANSRVFSR